ncbi:HNH endonuclease [Streptomyces sp. NPDC093109]|uniref:HNH endonuclease n=1 Tax=Streptomyces sp. NPDC093109 TaxID=3154977 RepID=UPI00344FD9B3
MALAPLGDETCDASPVEQVRRSGSQLKKHRRSMLAKRDGRQCFYCHQPFNCRLTGATIDHVVPRSLFSTNAQVHLVLACFSCNQAKADRLPLSIALLLCAYADGRRPDTVADTRDAVDTRTTWSVPETVRPPVRPPYGHVTGCADGVRTPDPHTPHGHRAGDPHTPYGPATGRGDGSTVHPGVTPEFTPVTPVAGVTGWAGWLALARLAAANESAQRSTHDLHRSTPAAQEIPPTTTGTSPDRPEGSTTPDHTDRPDRADRSTLLTLVRTRPTDRKVAA